MACIIYLSPLIYTYRQSGCKRYWSVIAGAPGDTERENLEMHLETVIVWTRCTRRLQSSEFGDALGDRDRVELRDALGGRNQAGFEMHLEAEIE